MEQYYFIQRRKIKEGPYSLDNLKQQIVYSEDLIWRSDTDQWKKASEFEELKGFLLVAPPPTPREIKIKMWNKRFSKETVKIILLIYVFTSAIIGFFSYSIANSSWNSSKGKVDSYYNSQLSFNEDLSAQLDERFLFRPLKAFFGTIHLTKEEQENSDILLKNLLFSSFTSFFIVFFIIGLAYYTVKRSSILQNSDGAKQIIIPQPSSLPESETQTLDPVAVPSSNDSYECFETEGGVKIFIYGHSFPIAGLKVTTDSGEISDGTYKLKNSTKKLYIKNGVIEKVVFLSYIKSDKGDIIIERTDADSIKKGDRVYKVNQAILDGKYKIGFLSHIYVLSGMIQKISII